MLLLVYIVSNVLSIAVTDSITYTMRYDCPTTVLNANLIYKSIEVTSGISCARKCQREGICASFNYLESNTCQMSSSKLDDTCSNGNENLNARYYQIANGSYTDQPMTITTTAGPTACLNGGVLVNDTCQCIGGYIGTTCERLMEDCTEGYPYYQGQFNTFLIQPTLAPAPIPTVCRMEYDKRTYLQVREATSGISFDRDWASYKTGFGDIYKFSNRDFWWGNENAYYLTNSKSYSLVVQVVGEDYTDIGNIVYNDFVVQDEAHNYAMSYSSVYIVPIEYAITLSMNDSMASSNGSPFSTYDQDNDQSAGNCALDHGAGWWFNNCADCNPNGRLWPGGNSIRVNVDNEFFWNNGLPGWSAWGTALWLFR